ncbi:hypothetical protein KIH31_03725 [Paenarthrobacter sp. DKR-5]|uniref:hypothetical protein n=1 Tax=Paenarthrobacter sp. DKR-5 TaxID=2835535 RepID=UPI001BDCB994|nr:hypothetical protein [Paenarthrobacter sp. DKR-5]MBT1001702.1 hypothetical protein [Paenarthrobacter sp. DKR-5]
MTVQVHRIAKYDGDVTREVSYFLKAFHHELISVQFVTTAVPDPKTAGRSAVLYEAYVTFNS